jgi:hypothetical protein
MAGRTAERAGHRASEPIEPAGCSMQAICLLCNSLTCCCSLQQQCENLEETGLCGGRQLFCFVVQPNHIPRGCRPCQARQCASLLTAVNCPHCLVMLCYAFGCSSINHAASCTRWCLHACRVWRYMCLHTLPCSGAWRRTGQAHAATAPRISATCLLDMKNMSAYNQPMSHIVTVTTASARCAGMCLTVALLPC